MTPPKAYDRAIAAVRQGNADLFVRLLAEEYQRWLTQPGAAAPAGDRGSADGGERGDGGRRGGDPAYCVRIRHCAGGESPSLTPGLLEAGGNDIQAGNGGGGHHACCSPARQGRHHHTPRTS
jgi:hypothetical protein